MFSELPEVGGDLLAGGVCFEKHSLEAASEVNLFKFWTIFKNDEVAIHPCVVRGERRRAVVTGGSNPAFTDCFKCRQRF